MSKVAATAFQLGQDRQVMALSDFTDADIAALEATRAPDAAKAYEAKVEQR